MPAQEDIAPNTVPNGTFTVAQDTQNTSCATFAFENEDHTLGNALRYVLVKK